MSDSTPTFGTAPTEEELEREKATDEENPDVTLDLTEEGDWMHDDRE